MKENVRNIIKEAKIWENSGNYEIALNTVLQNLHLFKDKERVEFYIGYLYKKIGEKRASAKYYEKANIQKSQTTKIPEECSFKNIIPYKNFLKSKISLFLISLVFISIFFVFYVSLFIPTDLSLLTGGKTGGKSLSGNTNDNFFQEIVFNRYPLVYFNETKDKDIIRNLFLTPFTSAEEFEIISAIAESKIKLGRNPLLEYRFYLFKAQVYYYYGFDSYKNNYLNVLKYAEQAADVDLSRRIYPLKKEVLKSDCYYLQGLVNYRLKNLTEAEKKMSLALKDDNFIYAFMYYFIISLNVNKKLSEYYLLENISDELINSFKKSVFFKEKSFNDMMLEMVNVSDEVKIKPIYNYFMGKFLFHWGKFESASSYLQDFLSTERRAFFIFFKDNAKSMLQKINLTERYTK